ncbi:MAG: prepilin-type N-terminal cleavage/methylation domain-containing protein [Verrucomicrobiota bacterium]
MRSRRPSRRSVSTGRERGFSLVEVMCAILILGVALAGLTQGVTTALISSKESELQTTAALLAAGRIETLRAGSDFSDGNSEGECGEGLTLYRWRQSISSARIDGLHEVEVVVENAKSGKSIYELRTMLFEPPDDSTGGPARQKSGTFQKRGGRQ